MQGGHDRKRTSDCKTTYRPDLQGNWRCRNRGRNINCYRLRFSAPEETHVYRNSVITWRFIPFILSLYNHVIRENTKFMVRFHDNLQNIGQNSVDINILMPDNFECMFVKKYLAFSFKFGPLLVQVIVLHMFDIQPLPELIMHDFFDAHMRHEASMFWRIVWSRVSLECKL